MKQVEPLILVWSGFELAFTVRLKRVYPDALIRYVSHHKSWFSNNRSYLLEFFHIFRAIYIVAFRNAGSPIILFGTNLCRLLWPVFFWKRDVIYIYNEMPTIHQSNLSALLDKVIFSHSFERIYLSSDMRLRFCQDVYNRTLGGYIPNIPVGIDSDICCISLDEKKLDEIIYAGLISSTRFSKENLDYLNALPITVNLLGPMVGDVDTAGRENIRYLGVKSQADSQRLQSKYRYALLIYPIDDLNNDYCAPIKIYEYVSVGCICVLCNDNRGLRGFVEEYPQLFVHCDKLKKFVFTAEEYARQQKKFLQSESDHLDKALSKLCNQIS